MAKIFEAKLDIAPDKSARAKSGSAKNEVRIGGEYPTALETLLISLGGCSGATLEGILEKMRKNVKGVAASLKGTYREDGKPGFSRIEISYVVDTPDATQEELDRAMQHAEKACPVWAMLAGSVEISSTVKAKA